MQIHAWLNSHKTLTLKAALGFASLMLIGWTLMVLREPYSTYQDKQRIEATMKKLFEKPGDPLTILAISVEDDVALADWLQEGKGGRALLQKFKDDWAVMVCGGASLRDAKRLLSIGMTEDSANKMLNEMDAAELKLSSESLKVLRAEYSSLPH